MASKNQLSINTGYLSVKELADKIGFNPFTVYEWIATRRMPIRRAGRRGRITIYWPEFLRWWQNLEND